MMGEFFIIKSRIKSVLKRVFDERKEAVLDLGCGNNPYYHKIIKGKVTCMDILKTDKTHIVADADSLPIKKKSFDNVIMVNSLYYFKNPLKVIENLGNVIRKHGKLVIVVPLMYPIHDVPDDKYRFTEYGLRTILENHFKVECIEPVGSIFTMPAVMLHSLIKGIPLLFPKSTRKQVQFAAYVLWPLYMIVQLLSLLDFLDRTKRFPVYYIAVAKKRS